MKRYDVAIIGAGVVGASIAYTLSKFNLNIILLEKEIDVSFGVSKANSGIVHAGFHHPLDTLKAKLEIWGNLLYTKLHKELNFPFKRCGAIVAGFNEEDRRMLVELYDNGIKNEVPGLELCNRERIFEIEPNINPDIIGGLYAPTAGIVEPYALVFALADSAKLNGVELKTEFEVVKVKKEKNYFLIFSNKGESISAHFVVNAAGLYADAVSRMFKAENFTIKPRKGEEYILDREASGIVSRVIYPVPKKNTKGTLVIPTVEGTAMVGPTADDIEDKTDVATDQEKLKLVFDSARRLIPKISERFIITAFAGLRPILESKNDFYIDLSQKIKNFVQVAGIQSPGLTAAPAIGEYVKDLLLKAGLKMQAKSNCILPKRDGIKIRQLTSEELTNKLNKGSSYSHIVCRCENISEGEIIEAIKHGHTTLDGIKFYTRAEMGRCQGGFCQFKIMEIIARETGIPYNKITKKGFNSYVVMKRLGEAE